MGGRRAACDRNLSDVDDYLWRATPKCLAIPRRMASAGPLGTSNVWGYIMGLYERRVLPILLDKMMTGAETERLRRDTLAPARGRVLEIGFGTGLNVPHYPPAVTHLVGVDPNPGMEKIARQRLGVASMT